MSEENEKDDDTKYIMDGIIWTKKELDETLYVWDKEAEGVVEELHKPESLSEDNWEIDLSSDAVHVVIFYAPWCPHCQNYKPYYIRMAQEVKNRSLATSVQFHALSCTLYESMCQEFQIDGYPTILGWQIDSEEATVLNGIDMPDLNTDLIGIYLDVPLIAVAPEKDDDDNIDDDGDETDEVEKAKKKEKKRKRRLKINEQEAVNATLLRLSNMEYKSSINDRYHNAFISFIQSLKTASGVILNSDKQQQTILALQDFLQLVDWATPYHHHHYFSWNNLIPNLLQTFTNYSSLSTHNIDIAKHDDDSQTKNTVEDWYEYFRNELDHSVDQIKKRQRHQNSELLGSILPVKNTRRQQILKDVAPKLQLSWTKACTHDVPAMGYTCGLWELFHIISVGATLPENQYYGFLKGYDVSSHIAAETIRNFIQYFFKCDVCRRNFLQMYDSCGHDHCTRLHSSIPFLDQNNENNHDLALWLWEVHNAVNLRLVEERTPSYRNVTQEERKASQFPSPEICPKCWNQSIPDTIDDTFLMNPDGVSSFLKQWYWPQESGRNTISYSIIHDNSFHDVGGHPLGTTGLILVMIPFFIAAIIVVRDNYTFITRYLSTRWMPQRMYGRKEK